MAQKGVRPMEKTRVLLVLDCSDKMQEQWQSGSKMKVTQQVLLRFLDSIAKYPEMEVGLRVFGHLGQESLGSRLEIPFEAGNGYKVHRKIKTLVPSGEGKTSAALLSARNDFPQEASSRNIVLLITSRGKNDDGSLCGLARQLQQSGDVLRAAVFCIDADGTATEACDSTVIFLRNEGQFEAALFDFLRQVRQRSWATLSLVSADGVPYETDVPVAFHDHRTHVLRKAVVYHYGAADRRDTLALDPYVTYDITFFTKPPVVLSGRCFPAEQVSALTVEAGQGELQLVWTGKKTTWTLPEYPVRVRRHGECEVVSTQPLGTKRSYLAGKYDLEVLTVPSMHLDNVELRAGSLTALQVEVPGVLVLTKPQTPTVGSLFVIENGELRWVCDLNPNTFSDRMELLPGDYQVILRPKDKTDYNTTLSTRFTITSAQQTTITMEP